MAKQKNTPECPILDLLTSDEIHRALLRTVLSRKGVQDPDGFMDSHTLKSQVMYRDVRAADGTTMMASVVITEATPKVHSVPSDPKATGE